MDPELAIEEIVENQANPADYARAYDYNEEYNEQYPSFSQSMSAGAGGGGELCCRGSGARMGREPLVGIRGGRCAPPYTCYPNCGCAHPVAAFQHTGSA